MAREHPFLLAARVEIEIPFFDVDPMNIVWHGHYLKYFETARCALLDKIGYGYAVMRANGDAWPVVQVQCKYIRPLVFGQKITVEARLTEYESCLKTEYRIFAADGTVLHRAAITQAAVDTASGETLLQTPAAWRQAVGRALQKNREEKP